ncbi:MAG: hypothetical protein FJX72_04235, partial [Armatimonadetes bacterium]|nr:hypothetical protein [Armatimonadota bacterium]
MDPSGASLAYSTYFGGSSDEIGYSISLWGQRACITGYTGSTNLYCTADAYQLQHAGSRDAFVCILNDAGSGVLYSTYIGGSSMDVGYGISVNGQALSVAGWTWDSPKMPVYRAYDPSYNGSQDAWVLKLDLRERVATTTTVPAGQMGFSGEPVTIQAVLTRQTDASPVSGAGIEFRVGGTSVGSAVTNGAGVASLAYTIPPELGVGPGYYYIRAEFAGDAAYVGSVGAATFLSLPYAMDGQVTWNGAGLQWVAITLEGDTRVATYEASSGGLSVPDLGTVTSQIPMTWLGEIESVRVQVNMTYTYASDLRISVIHPDGATVVLHDRTGWSLDYTASAYPDVVAPAQTLAVLAGKPANGTWTLKVEDMASGDTGHLNSWYLGVTLRQTDPNDTSRSSGAYGFSANAGTYTLRPWRDGYVFSPESRTVTVGPEQHSLDFVARMLTVLEADDAEGPSGSSVGLSAKLTALGGWVAGRTVTFTVDGSEAGGAVTDATGVATLAYEIPLSKGEGAYSLGAAFAGDDAYVASFDTATLTVLPPAGTTLYTIDRTGTITGLVILRQFDLKRTTDDALLAGKTISFGIDGTEVGTGVTNAGGDSTLNWIITDGPATRTIVAAFAGDAAYNGCSDDATLTCQTWPTKMGGVDREGKITAYRIFKAWLWKMDNSPVSGKSIAFRLD